MDNQPDSNHPNNDAPSPTQDVRPSPQAIIQPESVQLTEVNEPSSFAGQSSVSPEPIHPEPSDGISDDVPALKSKPKKKREGGIFSFVLTLVAAVVLVQLINAYVFQSYKVFGHSMEPSLQEGDRLIISKINRTGAKFSGQKFQPARGDVIVFIDPLSPDIQLIKRVIGLPGERVKVEGGKITVYSAEHPNGFNPDDQPYGKDLPFTSGNVDLTVPDDHLFVSGDNREGGNSMDSRNQLGTVPEDNIIGVLKVRFWPFNTARFF